MLLIKRFTIVVTIMVLVAGLYACIQQSQLSLFVRRSVVNLHGLDGRGTGFVVKGTKSGKPYIISCEHVCEGNKIMETDLYDRSTVSVVVKMDHDQDICALATNQLIEPALKLADTVTLSTVTEVFGFPYEYKAPSPSYGEITGVEPRPIDNPNGVMVYATNLHIFPGMSGSPAVNTQGEVVGMAEIGDGRTTYGMLVMVSALRDFLADL